MKSNIIVAATTLLALSAAFFCNEANAQRRNLPTNTLAPALGRRPPVSPYLNLLSGNGQGFAFNYFLRYQPEVQFRQQGLNFSQSLDQLRQRVGQQERSAETRPRLRRSTTGHPALFFNTGTYFPVRKR
jgi:hypothetical protein